MFLILNLIIKNLNF